MPAILTVPLDGMLDWSVGRPDDPAAAARGEVELVIRFAGSRRRAIRGPRAGAARGKDLAAPGLGL